jgi:hypothetical protein
MADIAVTWFQKRLESISLSLESQRGMTSPLSEYCSQQSKKGSYEATDTKNRAGGRALDQCQIFCPQIIA